MRGFAESLTRPLRTLQTVRHLQPRQLFYQSLRRLQPVACRDGRPVEEIGLLPRRPVPQAAPHPAFDGRTFCFLNRRLAWEGERRWDPAGADALWLFNLHYFRFLERVDPRIARTLITDWLAGRVPRRIAWHPYPISLRVREWIEWLHAHPDAPAPLRAQMTRSIAAQIESLRRRLEFHLMGNHLLENAITLCWAGLSCAGRPGDAWLAAGEALLAAQLRRQVLPDGAYEERSPMYQAQIAEALLRLAGVAAQSPKAAAPAIAAAARAAGVRLFTTLVFMTHPDGDYALLNDTALGVAPAPASLGRRFGLAAPRADRGTWRLPSAGLAGWRGGGRYLIFDAGPIGPGHQPGHGHAGALSFELSARARRIVTDTGVLTYADGSARRHDRSTAAHNTVEIDGRDQSEVWGAFRCGRRVSIARRAGDEGDRAFAGAYCGPGADGSLAVSHARTIAVGRRLLAFRDIVHARGDHRATLRVHLAPGLRVTLDGHLGRIDDEDGRPVATLAADGFEWAVSTSPYHPAFGTEVERPCVSAAMPFRHELSARWWLLLN